MEAFVIAVIMVAMWFFMWRVTGCGLGQMLPYAIALIAFFSFLCYMEHVSKVSQSTEVLQWDN
jgi:Na+-driven multidrug efflux pump